MNIRSLYGLAAVSLLLACQSNSYQITGFARSFEEGDTICLASGERNEAPFAQTIVCEGKFYFYGETDTISLCRAYAKHEPASQVTFFVEPGRITLELQHHPDFSRVSGTKVNNEWQQLSDSVYLLAQDMATILRTPTTDTTIQAKKTASIDSLHHRMSNCILHTAQRNADNPLGRYIRDNYKAPEFE